MEKYLVSITKYNENDKLETRIHTEWLDENEVVSFRNSLEHDITVVSFSIEIYND